MKNKVAYVVTSVITLGVGVALGVLLERHYGVEVLLHEETRLEEGSIPEAYQGKLQLFILAGQSNMSGWSDIAPVDGSPDPRIFVFGNDYHWKLAAEPIDDPRNQVDKVSEDVEAGLGPALPFAATILERQPDFVIGLIPCSKGNSSLDEWQRNLADNTLYGSCLKRTRAATLMGRVAGLLFFQGEADARDPKANRNRMLLPDQWEENFTIWIRDWRADLNLPELPVIFAELGTTAAPDKYPNWALVQEEQEQVHLPFVARITTADLPLKDDVHFTAESYQIIGERFAEAYLNLVEEGEK